MAFLTNVVDLQAALSACLTVRDWEMLTESIQIPEVILPMAYARLTELTLEEIELGENQESMDVTTHVQNHIAADTMEANEDTISAFDQLMNEYSQQEKLTSGHEVPTANVENEFYFLDSFTNADLREIEDMERVALKNKSHLSFIQKPRSQTKAWIKGRRIQKGHSRLRELFIRQKKEFERKKVESRKREEETKRKTQELRERERRYSEKLRNGTPEERERERVFQQEKKRHGGFVTDIMERRRWAFE